MSDYAAPGLASEHDEKRREAQAADALPERHESKVDDTDQPATGLSQGKTKGSDAVAESKYRNDEAANQNAAALHTLDTEIAHPPAALKSNSPASAGLSIRTNIESPAQATVARLPFLKETPTVYQTPVTTEAGLYPPLTSPTHFPGVGSSLRSALSTSSMASSISPSSASASALPSPYLAAMSDLTPLPSPLVGTDSPSTWRKSSSRPSTPSRSRAGSMDDSIVNGKKSSQTSPTSPPKKKKGYGSLLQGAVEASMTNAAAVDENAKAGKGGHARNRSISEFVPEQLQNIRPRHVTLVSGDNPGLETQEYHMQREAYLAAQRGLTVPSVDPKQHLPTPPPSTSSVAESDEADDEQPTLEDGTSSEYLEIHCGLKNKRRKFRQLRQLGQGTFSKVMLATRERIPSHPTPEIEDHLDPHKLVAVKIVEHGPAGGADEQRIETSLKREVEMLKSVSHPSLIHLKACEYQSSRALIVLTYCPGGDLFELASQKRELLTSSMLQRMFAELVSAVRYLHTKWIVHRDIKLENVLVNIPNHALQYLSSPLSYDRPIVTLTDLGLSRRMPDPPESPLLQTRCGSEDYAAPEILLGQPYDGRQTDAWALGVLLYALMEGRLPFDTPPGKPERSRNTHRIARCDWIWCRFGDEDGDWDPSRGADFGGARACVDGLLKKVRMGRKSLEEIEGMEWVQGGIQVPGGLKMRGEDEDDASL